MEPPTSQQRATAANRILESLRDMDAAPPSIRPYPSVATTVEMVQMHHKIDENQQIAGSWEGTGSPDGAPNLNCSRQRCGCGDIMGRKQFAQPLASVEHSCFSGTLPDSNNLGGIIDRSSVVIDQIDDFAMRWRQLRQTISQDQACFVLV